MTNQEAFTQALLGLRAQREASVTPANEHHPERCAYRNHKGLKCAVGMLIPDEVYNSLTLDIEGASIAALSYPAFISTGLSQLLDGLDPNLLADLQSAHDSQLRNYGLGPWEMRMKAIAYKYELVYESPTSDGTF